MRVLSYNILDGGEGRADPIGEVIEANRPDVVVLVEADDEAVVDRIARRLKMDYIIAPGSGHAVAILSRWTIERTINHALLLQGSPRSFCSTTILSPAGKLVEIIGLHLSAGANDADEAAREKELAAVFDATAELRDNDRPHLLVGDFNSNAPTQAVQIDHCHPKTQKSFAKNGGIIPRRVIAKLLDAGYTDSLSSVRSDAAKNAATFTTHHPGQRVDYIFTFGLAQERIVDAWVEQDRLAKYASDHYPVGVEVDLN